MLTAFDSPFTQFGSSESWFGFTSQGNLTEDISGQPVAGGFHSWLKFYLEEAWGPLPGAHGSWTDHKLEMLEGVDPASKAETLQTSSSKTVGYKHWGLREPACLRLEDMIHIDE